MDKADNKARETAKFLDNVTDFISSEQALDDILDSLRVQGVDPDESLQRFRQILSEHAPTWREKAIRARTLFTASLEAQKTRIQRSRVEIQDEIQKIVELMRASGAPVEAGAYHREFEEARDEDLESLLEDLRLQRDLWEKKTHKADSDV